jgi:hypothetical protein
MQIFCFYNREEQRVIWSSDKAGEWHKTKGWILGFNFLPSTAVNSTEMWQAESFDEPAIERELAAGAAAGYNSCRVFFAVPGLETRGGCFSQNF